ncbi:MAG: GH92 family glycosyl hydrolase [Clostridia bacterium]|nr:GH92 family glycosyl hydrolase [Clostridia bacterium]
MLKILRAVISLFVAAEMFFGSLANGFVEKPEMPETQTGEFTRYVNAFTGTGGIPWACAMLSPAACAPFGCVRVGPDTCAAGGTAAIKTNTSGYYYEHRHILGFSLGRLSGTGARDYGMFRVTPCVKGEKPACLAFSHNDEKACPGYYSVYLPAAGALCEMTAASHTAVMRFNFAKDKGNAVYIDAASILSSGSTQNAKITYDEAENSLSAETTLFGTFSGRYQGLKVYLYAVPDKTPAGASVEGAGALVRFDEKEFTLKTGISFVSAENAKENLLAETRDKGFDEIKKAALGEWEKRLSAIKIEADEETKQIFYTALYHAMIMPTDFTDTNGEYTGFDKKTHKAEGFTYRTDMSLWDTCRNAHSLYSLVAPDIQRDCVESLLLMAEQGGVLPRWPMGCGYSGSMFGNPADIVLAESYLKGFDFDARKAYEYMRDCADGKIGGDDLKNEINLFNECGYLPDDLCPRYSVSKTLEYAWERGALARFALALGEEEDCERFSSLARNYKNIWDDENKYFAPRNSDGSFGKFTPYVTSFFDDIFGTKFFRAYCEGGARHWRWSAQQDVRGLIELFGSEDYFVSELEKFMKDASAQRAALDPGSGFWIGNQHDIHTPYLFSEAGRPDLTQKWVRWTLKNRFSTDIDGLDGNDDGGTLSSWYVFSALGIYPLAGTEYYYIGSPCVDRAQITLGSGETLVITVKNQAEKNVYVKSATLDGRPLDLVKISHADIAQGGEIVFEMTDSGNQKRN